ncbi:MAG: O-antigen ligase family protein [Verrucomicrobiota bacterium]
MKTINAAPTGQRDGLARTFAVLFGIVLGLALLKFVNPAVFEKLVEWPANSYEWVINPWPVVVGYWLLAAVALLGIFVLQRKIAAPRWLIALPLVWLGWQFVSATHTVDAELTRSTLKHFVACVVCFYLGLFALARLRNPIHFLLPICGAFVVVIAVGIQQHFGGLEASRQYFFTYVYPQAPSVPPEYLKKLSSDRIFSTQFYPNALAGVVLLLLPATVAVIWQSRRRLTVGARAFLVGVVGLAALACLYWSGSKGGWLLMLVLGMVALLHLQFSKQLKVALVGVVLIAGLAGFALKYAGFFQRGAKSVGARFDYWEAAAKTSVAKPVFGTGPGTFGVAYKAIKRPESEMSRLAHNDYLQQASDSGLVGFLAYAVLVVGSLIYSRPKGGNSVSAGSYLRFSVWLGILGWSLQGLVEFGFYIPALAWCSFGWMGWLLGTAKPIDKPSSGDYSGHHK